MLGRDDTGAGKGAGVVLSVTRDAAAGLGSSEGAIAVLPQQPMEDTRPYKCVTERHYTVEQKFTNGLYLFVHHRPCHVNVGYRSCQGSPNPGSKCEVDAR